MSEDLSIDKKIESICEEMKPLVDYFLNKNKEKTKTKIMNTLLKILKNLKECKHKEKDVEDDILLEARKWIQSFTRK
jgi:transposase